MGHGMKGFFVKNTFGLRHNFGRPVHIRSLLCLRLDKARALEVSCKSSTNGKRMILTRHILFKELGFIPHTADIKMPKGKVISPGIPAEDMLYITYEILNKRYSTRKKAEVHAVGSSKGTEAQPPSRRPKPRPPKREEVETFAQLILRKGVSLDRPRRPLSLRRKKRLMRTIVGSGFTSLSSATSQIKNGRCVRLGAHNNIFNIDVTVAYAAITVDFGLDGLSQRTCESNDIVKKSDGLEDENS